IVVVNGGLRVSSFRRAELLDVDASGAIAERSRLAVFTESPIRHFQPRVAWRTLPLPDGGAVVVHQRMLMEQVLLPPPDQKPDPDAPPPYYSSGQAPPRADRAIVQTAVSVIPPRGRQELVD